jgi:hypothetical protein
LLSEKTGFVNNIAYLAHPQFLRGDLDPAGRAIPSDSKAMVAP